MSETELELQDTAPPLGDRLAARRIGKPGPSNSQQRASPTWAGFAVASVGLALIALLALLGFALLRRQGGSFAGFSVNTVGRPVEIAPRPTPFLVLQLFDGGVFRLAEQHGRMVVVNFWASWCPPCREEARTLEAAARRFRDRGVTFVGADVWDDERDARAFLEEFGVTYPNGPDPTGQILVDLGVTGIPETYIIDRGGRLVRRWIGPLGDRELTGLIDELPD